MLMMVGGSLSCIFPFIVPSFVYIRKYQPITIRYCKYQPITIRYSIYQPIIVRCWKYQPIVAPSTVADMFRILKDIEQPFYIYYNDMAYLQQIQQEKISSQESPIILPASVNKIAFIYVNQENFILSYSASRI